jgi:pheromone shutdown-related protein TraB
MNRVMRKVSFKEKMKILAGFFFGEKKELTQEMLEAMKQGDMLLELMEELEKATPTIKEVLVDERDKFMAYRIKKLPYKKILVVVGAGHTKGISENLRKNYSIAELMQAKPGIPYAKIVFNVLIILFLVFVIYATLQKGLEIGLKAALIWILVVGSFSGAGSLIAGSHFLSALIAFIASPITTLNPFLAAGWFSGLSELRILKPNLKDFKELNEANNFKELMKNKVFRVLLVAALTNIGAIFGLFLAVPWILKIIKLG